MIKTSLQKSMMESLLKIMLLHKNFLESKSERILRYYMLLLFSFIGSATTGWTQAIDYSNCASCNSSDISVFTEIQTKYQGLKGINPSAPSTFNLIGNRKFSGAGYPVLNPFLGENWYPIRTEKQHFTGIVSRFGVSNFGDESDWNIHLIPENGFEDFISDAIPYRSGKWNTAADGRYTVEAEITPDEHRYGNPWFTNSGSKTSLLNKRITVYGPFVREEAHGNHPEIHPSEQIWWKQSDNTHIVLLLNDDSNRFDDRADTVVRNGTTTTVIKGDYTARRVTSYAYQPWSPNKKQEAEIWVAFELNPDLGGLKVDLQTLDAHNFYKNIVSADVAQGDRYSISYKGNTVLTVQESAGLDPFTSITFRNVCMNTATGKLQGYIVIHTAVGNGNGDEGFVALQIDQRPVPINAQPAIVMGNFDNNWRPFKNFDEQVAFSDIITSDMHGTGIVDGMIDFNGNGITDLFAKKDNRWLVLFDATGTWQEINNSEIPVAQLRFGDISGDGKTDILRVGPNNKILASYGGTSGWTEITDGADQGSYIQVGDFNGDHKTDIVYLKYTSFPPSTPQFRADMYVKYSAKGSWRKLKGAYYFDNASDYAVNMRFGDFNGDGITDLFRYSEGRFGVYWNGTGSYKEIKRPSFAVKTEDLLFVPSMALSGYTDIIHVDRTNSQWTVFYKGREVHVLPALKFNDPQKVRFGNLEEDATWEMFAIDYVTRRIPTTEVDLNVVAPAVHEHAIMAKYLPGSVKKNVTGTVKSLTLGLSLEYYPGTKSTLRSGTILKKVVAVKNQTTGESLPFIANASADEVYDTEHRLVSIPAIAFGASATNNLQVSFKGDASPKTFRIPSLGIAGQLSNVREATGAAGNWHAWKQYLTANASNGRVVLLDVPPAPPVQVKEVQFEVVPIYVTPEEDGSASLEEIHEVANELNEIVYSYDVSKFKSVFTNTNAFVINWQFELKDLTTGVVLPTTGMVVTKGRWAKSKVVFPFPVSQNLLQLTATATIQDEFGNSSMSPTTFVFYNQKIAVSVNTSAQAITNWLAPIKNAPVSPGFIWVRDHWERPRANQYYYTYQQLFTKVQYHLQDGVLTPADVSEITGVQLK